MWPIDAQRLRLVCSATSRAPSSTFSKSRLESPWPCVTMQKRCAPAALFRLCGGRVENLGALQPLAVKAGLNGVMMGNFLTTLGSTPDEDREMFTDLGLNVARQPDNGANPRPDNRSGWLDGELPEPEQPTPMELHIRMWDPASQLRFKSKTSVPVRPDGSPNAWPREAA